MIIDEKKRMSWDDIFKHPLVKEYFLNSLDFNKSIIDPALYLINEIRIKIIEKDLNLDDLVKDNLIEDILTLEKLKIII